MPNIVGDSINNNYKTTSWTEVSSVNSKTAEPECITPWKGPQIWMNKKIPISSLKSPKPLPTSAATANVDEPMEQLRKLSFYKLRGPIHKEELKMDKLLDRPTKPNLRQFIERILKENIKPSARIYIDGVKFHCHLIMLQAYSSVFADCVDEIILAPDRITASGFQAVYEWILADEPKLSRNNIIDIYRAAKYLKLECLMEHCWCYFSSRLFDEQQAFLLYWEAKDYDDIEEVHGLMLTRIFKSFLTLVAADEFVQMSHKDVHYLLSSNQIGVNTEVEVFYASLRWLANDWDNRKVLLVSIMSTIRFGLLPPTILVSLSDQRLYFQVTPFNNLMIDIYNNKKVRKMITDGLSYATIRASYACEETFRECLRHYKIEKPTPRYWIFHSACSYHNACGEYCPNNYDVSYKSFSDYLELLESYENFDYIKEITEVNCPKVED